MLTALPNVVLVTFGAILGAVFGSFIATLVVRWPAGRSVARGRSACDGCGVPIAAVDLIPLASFLLHRGRTRCCATPIDRIHPIAELAATAIGALAFLVAPPLAALFGAIFGWLLLALALLDIRCFWLPDRLTLPLALLGLLAGIAGQQPPILHRLIGGAIGFAIFAAIRHGYRLLRGREGMGGGDPKLFGAIGLWLGWAMLPMVVLGASLLGLAFALALNAAGRTMARDTRLPFGPFLAIAAWAVWLAEQAALRVV